MAQYLLNGDVVIKDDSTMKKFAQSLCSYLDLHYTGESNFDDYKEESMKIVQDFIMNDLRKTDINYVSLMYQYRNELGSHLYDMESYGYDLGKQVISFSGDAARECFESLLYKYIEIRFLILTI